MSQGILLSDTNVLLKLMLFENLELDRLTFSSYGLLKFHPIVQSELSEWIKKYKEKGRHKKIDKFSLPLIEKALKLARTNTQIVSAPSENAKKIAFNQYESIAKSVKSESSPPSENDWMLLYHAEIGSHYMISNDDIVYKVGKHVIGNRSLEVEDLIIDLLRSQKISEEQVYTYVQALNDKNELFKTTKVFLAVKTQEK